MRASRSYCRPGTRTRRSSRARVWPGRRQDPRAARRHLRHRPPPRAVGRLGRREIQAPLIPGTSSTARSSRWVSDVTRRGRRPRVGRGAHRVRHVPQLPRRPPPPVHPHQGVGRQPRRRVRRLHRHPGDQRLGAAARPRPRPRRDLRPARQRDAHGARSGRWSARTCSSPAPGRSGSWRPRSRGTPGPAHRRERHEPGCASRRPPAPTCRRRVAARRIATRRPARHGRGVRHRARDVGSRVAVEEISTNMNHGGRVALLGLPPSRSRSTGARS